MNNQLRSDAVRRKLSEGPVGLNVGIGGGGWEFVGWLADRLGFGRAVSCERTDAGQEWQFSNGKIVDSAAVPPLGAHVGRAGHVRVHLGQYDEQSWYEAEPGTGIAEEFLRTRSSAAHEDIDQFIASFGHATSLVDVHEWESVIASHATPGYNRRVEGVARRSYAFREHFLAIQNAGGSRLLDLGRIVYLLAPEAMHLGDEWASLASANSGRVYSLADINLVLGAFTDLFALDSASEIPTVEAASPFVRVLFSGFVPASSSEYVEIYQWMSRRAVASLVRSDSSDYFIRSALPLVASRGGCMPMLLEDGAVMLAADVARLSDYLERDPKVMISPGAKAVLQHAHRLKPGRSNREAQMEFALRRMSLATVADRIADALPGRAWRPVWSSTSPSNVHRVLSEDPAGVQSIAVVAAQHPFRAYAALGNGTIRQLSRGTSLLLDTDVVQSGAAFRGVAAAVVNGEDYVAAAASDGTVRVLRVIEADGPLRVEQVWIREDPDNGPLTTVAIWSSGDGRDVVLSGGVSGSVWCHDLVTAEDLGALVEWGAEIRGIRVVDIRGAAHAVVAAVDGRVALLDLADGREVAATKLADWVRGDNLELLTPSCIDAVEAGDRIHVLLGCATGQVFQAMWSPGEDLRLEALELPGVPDSGVNAVAITVDDSGLTRRYIARNDGVWLRHDPFASRNVKAFVGHAGPVLSQAVMRVPGTGEVVSLTGGAEGTVRIWRHVESVEEALAYLRVNRHRGAIRTVSIRPDTDDLQVITGGDDGEVRVWLGSHAIRGTVVSHHQGHVSSLLWLPTPAGLRLVVGASDGTLRTTTTEGTLATARLLGIAHEGVTALTAGSAGGVFWSAGNDGGVTRWDALAGVARETRVVCRYGGVTSMLADGRGRLYVGGQDGSVSFVDPDSLHPLSVRRFDSAVLTLDIIPDRHLLVIGLASGQVLTLDVTHGPAGDPRLLFRHSLGAVAVKAVDLHGQTAVASVGRDRKLVVIEINSRAVLHEIGLEGFPTDVSSSGGHIAVSTTAGVTLFEFADG